MYNSTLLFLSDGIVYIEEPISFHGPSLRTQSYRVSTMRMECLHACSCLIKGKSSVSVGGANGNRSFTDAGQLASDGGYGTG